MISFRFIPSDFTRHAVYTAITDPVCSGWCPLRRLVLPSSLFCVTKAGMKGRSASLTRKSGLQLFHVGPNEQYITHTAECLISSDNIIFGCLLCDSLFHDYSSWSVSPKSASSKIAEILSNSSSSSMVTSISSPSSVASLRMTYSPPSSSSSSFAGMRA